MATATEYAPNSSSTHSHGPPLHNAPAGSFYKSIGEAERDLLQTNCKTFLEGEGHVILPPIFINEFTDQRGEDSLIITLLPESSSSESSAQKLKLYLGELTL